ncbi:hypothetical protein DFJ74DRAFT_694743 [Hyaloraphidium curvatum]|nr:hypothetical protein DFJ74DRAFT_694743 [Hyaloraphidium curvatum]
MRAAAICAAVLAALAVPASAAPLVRRGCANLTVDAFERAPGTALGLNAYDRAWTDGGTMASPPRIVRTAAGGALEFAPAGGESWLLSDFSCANLSRYDAVRFVLSGPSAVYGIGAMTGGCKTAEPQQQWYLPLQFTSASGGAPTEVIIPLSQLFPGQSSVNLRWIAWQGFPPKTVFQMQELTLVGREDGCGRGEGGSIPGQGAWLDAPPPLGNADPGPVATIPILPTGPRPYADLAPNYLWTACPDGAFALTFDDGPWMYTNDLLDILKKNDVKATFFINGNNKGRIDDHINVVRRAVAEGHIIGSHTWSHTSLANLDEPGIVREMNLLSYKIKDIIGAYPTLMRPPFGAGWNEDRVRGVLGKLGFHIVMYELDPNDYATQEGVQSYDDTIGYYKSYFEYGNGAKKGGVLSLSHDVLPTTVYNLTQAVIDMARTAGYRFALVDECVNKQDPKGWKPYSDTACLSNGTCIAP